MCQIDDSKKNERPEEKKIVVRPIPIQKPEKKPLFEAMGYFRGYLDSLHIRPDMSVVQEHKCPRIWKQDAKNNLAPQSDRECSSEVRSSWSASMERRVEESQRSVHASHSAPLLGADRKNTEDPLLVHEYVNDILAYHLRVEFLYSVPTDYITIQSEITGNMRTVLVNWLIEVHQKFNLLPDTLYLAVSCIDRFLAKKQISRKDLQLIGVVGMLISAKYEEVWPPEVRDFKYISDKAYSRYQIITMEKTILNALGFQLTVPTAYLFLQRFLKLSRADDDVIMLSKYLLELALVEYSMLRFPCSKIAASAVYIAKKCMLENECWNNDLQRHTGYSLENLHLCIVALTTLQKLAPESNLQAVYRKYSEIKFKEITKISYDDELLETTD